ncbi:hypothetical protein GQ54DRAFT_322496 [Martensiomyces pterosporus]|nr:hypothetical protein GQ54DRAFT_322496 [Martensiomyces pterosporus]
MSPPFSLYLSSAFSLHATTCYPYVLPFLNTLIMAFLDQLPLDILLAVVKWFKRDNWDKLEFCKLLPVTSVNTSLRQSLIPLLYRNLAFETLVTENRYGELRMAESNGLPKPTIRTRHNAALANSAGCSEAVRDDMDAGSKTKWPNLDSYTYTYRNMMLGSSDRISWLDIIKQLDKELPRLRHASSAACEVSSGILPLTYNPPSVSFSTQITSLHLDCYYQDTETSRLPQIFAPTLVDLTLTDTNPENIWNIFCDGQESHTVVFARLTRLDIWFTSPLYWGDYVSLPPHLQGATSGMLTKRSVWTAGAASGRSGCRVPLFPVLRALRCKDMVYDFHDFISRTQCHDSLESLCVSNGEVYFDFDAELFKTLESVEFDARFPGKNEESTGSVDLYKSAFTSLLRAKTDMQRMLFSLTVRDTLFQVPPDIGCANLRSLFLGVEVDFKSMLRLLSKLKNLVELRLNINGVSTYSPRGHHCYTASYALELALHLPVLERMTLSVDDEGHVGLFEALLDRAVRDDMDAGSKTKWPNLDSYTYTYRNMMLGSSDRISWLDIIKQLDKELPRLRHASSAACEVSSGILPLTYNPPSVSFSTQITSLHLDCYYQDTETSRLPQIFAPTLVDLTLTDTNPENIWNIFCDGQESHTVVFARLTRLDIWFTSPLYWGDYVSLPPHLQGATSGMLTKRSVWTAGAASGRSGCRVPLFPVLRALRCKDMVYDFHDFISRTQCHDSLESLCVSNGEVYFDFDAELFKTLESVEFDARFPGKNEESTGSVDLYKSAFTSLLRAKTDMQRMLFSLTVRDTLFQVPPDIGCANLRSLFLGVEVDFKSMLRLLSKLKNLVELRLNINGVSTYSPRGHHCYTASYALELALHLPVLERMTLSVDDEGHVGLFEALLDSFIHLRGVKALGTAEATDLLTRNQRC